MLCTVEICTKNTLKTSYQHRFCSQFRIVESFFLWFNDCSTDNRKKVRKKVTPAPPPRVLHIKPVRKNNFLDILTLFESLMVSRQQKQQKQQQQQQQWETSYFAQPSPTNAKGDESLYAA
jgi:hypothetical protein